MYSFFFLIIVQVFLWIFCNARIYRHQTCKSGRKGSVLVRLGDAFSLWSMRLSPVFLCTLCSSVLVQSLETLALVMLLSWLKCYLMQGVLLSAGCNRYLPSVRCCYLFSFPSGVIWDTVVLCLKWGANHLLGIFVLGRHEEGAWETAVLRSACCFLDVVPLRKNEAFQPGVRVKSCLPYSVY